MPDDRAHVYVPNELLVKIDKWAADHGQKRSRAVCRMAEFAMGLADHAEFTRVDKEGSK